MSFDSTVSRANSWYVRGGIVPRAECPAGHHSIFLWYGKKVDMTYAFDMTTLGRGIMYTCQYLRLRLIDEETEVNEMSVPGRGSRDESSDVERSELRAAVNIVVMTPGRFIDHLQQGNTSISRISFVVLEEADRMLDMGFEPQIKEPGGYFAYLSPEAYAQDEEDLKIWREMSTLVECMCWKIAAKRNQTVILAKPLTNEYYEEREPSTQLPVCRSDDDPNAALEIPMEACITPYSDHLLDAQYAGRFDIFP
ncbi:hypothetical protein GIB67_038792 [Kingdonia uniflora]|uniref:Methyltransferase n=1 Tax=Kingdonia uniflora TaxID=39325 RepID=A0A7J7M0R3_9MAGN|nr:hypothetical protein GIB67_038792 [Kingdonia uniflora]